MHLTLQKKSTSLQVAWSTVAQKLKPCAAFGKQRAGCLAYILRRALATPSLSEEHQTSVTSLQQHLA